ncbi:hypothetical protein [Dyella tabacisoli]|uniref:DUF3077 domain-containing protein n=1 Tax=Dyella tabacisoli TaxID=2282381 RepID=A0A369UKK8_9GAMM|nr:hypothetical protein [Dyella tabacisoli]RDD80258.1 hypothetical protein DVJ77_18305 [Dyella tabacisoli]
MAAIHLTATERRIRLNESYDINPDATPERLFDDVNELLDHARAIALSLCHALTPNAQVDYNHLSSVFAAIANMIDMAQNATEHAHFQLLSKRVKSKSKSKL